MFRNKDFKRLILGVLFINIIFIFTSFIILKINLQDINRQLVLRDNAMIEKILKTDSSLEDELVAYITGKIEIPSDSKPLEKYGYSENLELKNQWIYQAVLPSIYIRYFVLIIVFLGLINLLIYYNSKKVYGKINIISKKANNIVEGKFDLDLIDGDEGDISILNHNFNQMANRLKNTLARLEEDKNFLRHTISDISHQIKTPLSSLIMINDIMLENEDMDKEKRKEFLLKSNIQLERMEWLIINLLKMARIESGAISFKKNTISTKELIESSIKDLEFKLRDMDLIIGKIEGSFEGDFNWIKEALINILKNATEHGADKIWIGVEDSTLFTSIKIRDNGHGISKDDISHIFERFYKSKSSVNPDSIGIGLNLAKLIVDAQNGSLSVRSQKDIFTEFTISFLKEPI